MVQINFAQKQVNAKIVFYGPGMSGKTTNLEVVHARAPDDNRGDLTSISTDGDRTLFFDFMPLDLGTVAGMRTTFQIYTVPGQVYYNSTRKLVLQGVDGVVFVADSSASMTQENLESLRNLEENLNEYGKSLATTPHVIQFNKRDLPDALPVAELNAMLNQHNAPTFEAVANTGQGVFPTLKALAARVLDSIHSTASGGSGNPAAPAAGAPAAPTAPAAATPAPVQQQAAPAPMPQQQQPLHQTAMAQNPMQQAPQPMAAPAQASAAPATMAQPPLAPAPQQAQGSLGVAPAQQQQQQAGLQMAQTSFQNRPQGAVLSGGMGSTGYHARPGAAPMQQQGSPSPAAAPAASKRLEGTRFRPRGSGRSAPRPTHVQKKQQNKMFTGVFVVVALVVGAALAGVILTFF